MCTCGSKLPRRDAMQFVHEAHAVEEGEGGSSNERSLGHGCNRSCTEDGSPTPFNAHKVNYTDRKNEKGPAIFHLHAELTMSRVPTKVASIWDNL